MTWSTRTVESYEKIVGWWQEINKNVRFRASLLSTSTQSQSTAPYPKVIQGPIFYYGTPYAKVREAKSWGSGRGMCSKGGPPIARGWILTVVLWDKCWWDHPRAKIGWSASPLLRFRNYVSSKTLYGIAYSHKPVWDLCVSDLAAFMFGTDSHLLEIISIFKRHWLQIRCPLSQRFS